ncbi:hypothetical protein SARC_13121 [Sphaeroforma arctica JP610]|uniref:Charged multivesicular body protein 6 n=1 Tax=Sphaeroforma arctica JP610 TaxID=667725 RepID=A0A0L0FCW1_9EUKA|nr:hypothetical protein SARC_13121 [Sphaeroforma arctica JP610]KNC74326.1 hypothetical protein SARC_13121 [Sphaeroforma arctica JP610]|eukprot:XP_014148228.1 hypothetical protein SARC_13121 [Sphaeroforma arctica JP610]
MCNLTLTTINVLPTLQLSGSVEKEQELAKKALASGDRKRALLFLKKKKYQQSLLDKAENQHANIEEMIGNVEFASIQKEVFERLKAGKEVLEAINKEISLDDVDKLMEENEEAIAYQDQVAQALGTQLSSQDEEDVLAELAALDELDAAEVAAAASSETQTENFPAVPDHTPAKLYSCSISSAVVSAEADASAPQARVAEAN